MPEALCSEATTATELHAEGNRLFKEGDLDAACDVYRNAMAALAANAGGQHATEQPTMSAVLCNRSAALLKLGRHEEAIVDAARAVFMDSKSVKPRYRQACALKALGRNGDAIKACDAGLAISTGNSQLSELKRACAAALAAAGESCNAPIEVSDAAAGNGTHVEKAKAAQQQQQQQQQRQGTAPVASPAPQATAEAQQPEEEELADDGDYASFCQATANRLYFEGESGQAVAWYTHAITALTKLASPQQGGGGGGTGTGADDGAVAEAEATAAAARLKLATLMSNRSAAYIRLERWVDAARDAEKAVVLDASLVKAYARGSAALTHLGHTSRSVELAELGLASARPPDEARDARLEQLRAMPVRELRLRVDVLRRQASKRATERARDEMSSKERRAVSQRGVAPCLQRPQPLVEEAGGQLGAAKPLEKGELVREVENLERAAEVDGEGLAYNLAAQALAEACAMRERVEEISEMANACDWRATLEHTRWLAAEYPQHRALRAMQLDALMHLSRLQEAAKLCEEQLHVSPGAPELLYAEAMLEYLRSGPDAAVKALSEVELDQPEHARSADLDSWLRALLSKQEEARQALLSADIEAATELACHARCLAEGSHVAAQAACLLLARCLARAARHVEVVSVCDEGLKAAAALAKLTAGKSSAAGKKESSSNRSNKEGGGGGKAVGYKGGAPSEHERLLLRRAASFAAIGQYAEAVADYRSAASLNPNVSQLAAEGLKEAWRALQSVQKRESLYEILGVDATATPEELRRAYRKAALLWHPDRHTNEDAAKQVEADAKFKELAAAWAVLGDEETRAAYDDDLEKRGEL